MPGPGIGGFGRGAATPKSILADKSHASYPIMESNSLRVTFAQTTMLAQRASAASGERPDTPNFASAVGEFTNKLPLSSGDEASGSQQQSNSPHSAPLSNDKQATLSENWRKNYMSSMAKQKSSSSKSTLGMLLSEIKSGSSTGSGKKLKTNTQATTSKSKKKLSRKSANRSVSSNMSFRKKKTKKRKKNKVAEDVLEQELSKPVSLSEEYAQELSKITQIIKAVTSDGSTTKESGSASNANSARSTHLTNTPTTFYSYSGGVGVNSNTTTHTHDLTTIKPNHPRRPLSGDELKQLLRSITRVVSLHRLPVDSGLTVATAAASKAVAAQQEPLPKVPPAGNDASKLLREAEALGIGTTATTTPPPAAAAAATPGLPNSTVVSASMKASNSGTSTVSSKKVKKKKKFVHKKIKYPLQIEGSPSEPLHKGRPKRIKSGIEAQDLLPKKKSSTGGKDVVANKVKSKTKPKKGSKPQKDDDQSSVSSLEKDPVKQAAFLRKYFEESVRLANKKSSEVLPQSEIKSDIDLAPSSNMDKSSTKRKPKKKNSPTD